MIRRIHEDCMLRASVDAGLPWPVTPASLMSAHRVDLSFGKLKTNATHPNAILLSGFGPHQFIFFIFTFKISSPNGQQFLDDKKW